MFLSQQQKVIHDKLQTQIGEVQASTCELHHGVVGFAMTAIILLSSCTEHVTTGEMTIGHLMGEMAGEVTATRAILQSRLTHHTMDTTGVVPGQAGIARFEVATDSNFTESFYTEWLTAGPTSDYIVKTVVEGLESARRYYYRLEWGVSQAETMRGERRTFRTLSGEGLSAETRFVVVTGMHYGRFRLSERGQQADAHLGYPALVSILERQPDFFVGTGDNVYYDHHPLVTSVGDMRHKWHEQFVQQRYIDLFAQVPTYWEKDDHDLRYDDCDSTDTPKDPERVLPLPLFEDGVRLFREQVPIVDPNDPDAVTYRTHRVSEELQVWFLEGRDYRSPNLMPDGPEKTMWGVAQRTWLQETLLASDATFKIIVSPTPMVGPDDLRKKDNHTNVGGFRYEGDAFFAWAEEHDMRNRGLYFVCGDRHWQYHSIHPLGFEEFSSGALVDGNARLGVKPGDPKGTDPNSEIRQPFTSPEASGGFLEVHVQPATSDQVAAVNFNFFDENGGLIHTVQRLAIAQ